MLSRQLSLFVGLIMLSLLLVGAASASYPMFHYDPQRTGYVPGEGPQTNATLWVAETAEFAEGSPAVHNGKVFVPTWPDMNFDETNPMGLVCHDAATGVELWTNELGGAGVGSVSGVAVTDGRVYLGGTDGRLYCVDEETGETLWASDRIDATGYFGLSSSPLVYEGTIYALSASDGMLHALNLDGTVAWTFETGNGVLSFTSPTGYDGKIYCAGNRSQIFCIDPATRSAVWTFYQGGSVKSSPVVGGDGTVYFTTNSRCYALDGTTGTERWNSSVTGTAATPALANGHIYAGAYDGLHCLDASTGEEKWHFPAKEVNVAPAVAGNLVYAATNEETGTVYAVDAGTGEEVWSYTLKAAGDGTFAAFFASSPAVSDGVLYIGAENNRFYAFGEGEVSGPAFTGWSGSVRLTDGQTFTVTPFNNESVTYTINRTSALGALDDAATRGGFDYTVQETAWGAFLYSIGGIAYNETSWDSWLYAINGETADVGAADYHLKDGDVVTYWYGPWGSTPETAVAVVTITVAIPAPGSGGGGGDGGGDSPSSWITATLNPGTFTLTADNSKKTYDVSRQTALGALDAAGVEYTVDDTYYQQYGSLFIDSVRGRTNEGARGWMYQVNGESPGVGANACTVKDGDNVVFFWSESMSSTPATSPDVVSIRVVIPTSSCGSGSDSSGGGSSGSSLSPAGGGQPGGGEQGSASFHFGLPAGAAVELGEWGQAFSVNTTGDAVAVSGNTLTINQGGLVLTIAAKNIDEKDGVARGLIERVTAAISPVSGEIEGLGTVTASLDLNLTGIPAADGRLDIALNATPDAATANAFTLAAAEKGEEITALAYTMTVTRTNLENGEDIAGAVIRMTISTGWVEEHGGVGALRIARSAEDGTYRILETRVAGTDENGNLIVEAVSPGGLSTFGLLAVAAAPPAQDTPAAAATAPVPGTGAVTATPPPSLSSPPVVAIAGAVLLIAAVCLVIEWRRQP
ncbi:PQQ-binding-like beta-propeller repeat protein [Methanoculleus sp. 10]|uniref:outer membrane protein assembly factor BamB family protein n=1 Tax=Methanoculleus sp. 10 TaxID=430615 RepID=UPI0025DAB775|nr:PQQ-binding-like beta-propeller repeat protein [Methanoculleus sp. 10]